MNNDEILIIIGPRYRGVSGANLIRKDKVMRKRDGKEISMDLPQGTVCGQCKSFTDCHLSGIATVNDEQCEYIPSKFALPGNESRAEVYLREYRQRYEESIYATSRPGN